MLTIHERRLSAAKSLPKTRVWLFIILKAADMLRRLTAEGVSFLWHSVELHELQEGQFQLNAWLRIYAGWQPEGRLV